MKDCPSCGETIKSQAQKCRHCGAMFGSRDYISEEAYASREYEGAEFNKARNKIILLFFLSASGCLSFPMIFVNGFLIWGKGALGVEFRRLPPALKAIQYVSFGISAFLMFLLVVISIIDSF